MMRGVVFEKDSTFELETVSSEIFNLENSVSVETLSRGNFKLIQLIEEKIRRNEKFFSFELFPVMDLGKYQRFFTETKDYLPLFYALTWPCSKNNNDLMIEDILPLKIACHFPRNTLLHLAAKGLKKDSVEKILNHALELRIENILALQGDPISEIIEPSDFTYAADLVTFMREQFDSKFCICVGGYPEMHPKSPSKELDLFYLKEKVDAGANFIITQIFFEARVFIEFCKDCRKFGITVPIIPGIFPITDYRSLIRMSNVCHVKIPKFLLDALEPIKDNDESVRKLGTEFILGIIKEIFRDGAACGYHLFTLNRSSVVLDVCGLPISI